MQTQQEKPKVALTRAQKVLLLLPALAAIHTAYYYPSLPERMATHFGPSGKADGWMSKSANAIFYIALVGVFSLAWVGIGWLLKKTPDDMINVPNKEFWLAPERREQSLTRMGHQMATFGIATIAFLMAVMQTVFLSNLRGSDQLGSLFFVYFAGFMLYTGIWTVQMLRDWKLPNT